DVDRAEQEQEADGREGRRADHAAESTCARTLRHVCRSRRLERGSRDVDAARAAERRRAPCRRESLAGRVDEGRDLIEHLRIDLLRAGAGAASGWKRPARRAFANAGTVACTIDAISSSSPDANPPSRNVCSVTTPMDSLAVASGTCRTPTRRRSLPTVTVRSNACHR